MSSEKRPRDVRLTAARSQVESVMPGQVAALEGRIDAAASEAAVRSILEDFNGRVIEARRQSLHGGAIRSRLGSERMTRAGNSGNDGRRRTR